MRVDTSRYPARAIGLITIGANNTHLCTGWMISRNTVATAGHCVHTGGSNGAWRDRTTMRFWPGRNGTAAPFGSCTVQRLHSNTAWTNNANHLADYGAMRLNCTIGNSTGFFGMYSAAATGFFLNQPAIISGYPGDAPVGQTQLLSADIVRVSQELRVCYRMDTAGGHSGSPIWNDRNNALATNGAWAFAVHAYGNNGSCGTSLNYAPRLTAGRINLYTGWINQS